jgi:hypothetical protein
MSEIKKELTKEENLKYQLETLISFDKSDLDYPEMDVGYENVNGEDCFSTVCLLDLGKESLARINELEKQLAEIMPDKIWCAANKVLSMYFYTEEDAKIYASSFGAACFMEVFAVDVLRLQEKANNE